MVTVDTIKILLHNTNTTENELIETLIDSAKQFVKTYTGCKYIDERFDNVIIKMVLEDYNRLGSEGISSQSIAGTSESYNNDYSDQIYKQLKRFRKVKFV